MERMGVGVGNERARSVGGSRVGGDCDGLHGWFGDETSSGGGDRVENSLLLRMG